MVNAMRTPWLCWLLFLGCPKKAAHSIECFDVTANRNSPPARAVFASRHCQGGGVTWGALLRVLARRVGTVEPVLDVAPGWTGGVYTLDGATRFSVDDEGSAARFCSDDPELVKKLREAYPRL